VLLFLNVKVTLHIVKALDKCYVNKVTVYKELNVL